MIIDIHTHVGVGKHCSATMAELYKEMQKSKATHSVCFSMGDDVEESSFKIVEEANSSIFSFFRFDPKSMTGQKLNVHLEKFSGVKLHPRLQNFDPLDNRFTSLFRVIEKHNIPVLIHTRKENNPFSDPDRLLSLPKMYPNIDFIFGHFANAVDSVIQSAGEIKNLYLETSIVCSPVILEIAVKKIGSKKILFGSDFPYADQELALQNILRSSISQEDKQNILYKNAMKLLRL